MRGKLLGADERLVIVTDDGQLVEVDREGGAEVYAAFDAWTQTTSASGDRWDAVEEAAAEYCGDAGVSNVTREAVPTPEAPPTATAPPTPQVQTPEATSSSVRVSGVVQATGASPFGWEPAPQWAKDAKDADNAAEDAETKADLDSFESGLQAMHPSYFQLRPDWPLLRTQKAWLAAQPGDEAEGLLNLLDAIQDQAVLNGHATEAEVFGLSSTEPACDFCNDTQKIDGEACGWCTDVAYTAKPKRFAVVNLATDDQPTGFDTLEEARGCVAFDWLTRWEIWDGDTLVDSQDGPEAAK